MNRVDYSKLTALSSDKNARINLAKDSSDALYYFTMALGNTIDTSSSWSESEMAMITASLNRWVLHKNDISNTKYSCGDIVLLEFGMNYSPELSYNHAALILEDIGDMVMVVPATSTEKVYNIAYHPKDNPNGKWYYRRVMKKDGFTKDCSLILSNLKVVAKSSIIRTIGNLTEDINNKNSLFREVRNTILAHTFSKEYVSFIKEKDNSTNMKNKIEELEEKVKCLTEENRLLTELIDNA